jgi:hypothetical protein
MKRTIVNTILDATEATPKSCKVKDNFRSFASYQVSVHLAEGFQRRILKCEKLTDDGRQVMAKAHIASGKVN